LKLVVKAELLLGGVLCTLKELAAVVAALLIVGILFTYFLFFFFKLKFLGFFVQIIIEVVWLVLSIVGFLDVTLCGVIATIG
jgi:hypothetical protein